MAGLAERVGTGEQDKERREGFAEGVVTGEQDRERRERAR